MRWFFAYVFCVLAVASGARAQFSGGGGPATGSPASNSELQQRCDARSAAACDTLGLRYYKSGKGSATELKKSAALFQKACDGGDAIGCSHLARSFLYGRGVKEDHARAIRLSETACKGDAEIACFIMGLAYDDGLAGYPKDRSRAISYYRLACGNGTKFDHACEVLAELGASSSITQVAPVVAVAVPQPDWKAAALAANEAGVAAYNRRDFAAAVEDFATACNGGLAMGCYNLAMRYWNGEGVAADKPYALQLYKRSCAEGVTMACAQASAASTLPPPQQSSNLTVGNRPRMISLRNRLSYAQRKACGVGSESQIEQTISREDSTDQNMQKIYDYMTVDEIMAINRAVNEQVDACNNLRRLRGLK